MTLALEDVVQLRLDTAQGPIAETEAARSFFAGVYDRLIHHAQKVETLRTEDTLVGLIILTAPQPNRFSAAEPSLIVLLKPDALDWARSTLRRLDSEGLPPHLSLSLNATDRALLSTAHALGLRPAKLELMGPTQRALAHLEGHTTDPARHGVRFSPAKVSDAPAIHALMRDFFLKRPELGWGGAPASDALQAKLDAAAIEGITRRISADTDADFIVTRGDALLGAFNFQPRHDHPAFGSFAGVNIVLLPEIQGLGLGKAAYLCIARHLKARGVERLLGQTSNPAVIHLGLKMGRRLRRIILRRDGPFIPDALIPSRPH